ncbi:MAG: MFS transporter [Acidobacteria bacterium]|nr:MFS transporter [Acidobacteriota bacterium]
MIFPLLPFYALKLNASPTVIGMILASFFVAQLISAPLWGRVSDRYGRRPALLIGLTGAGIGYLIFAFADSVWLLFISRIMQGAGGGTTGVTQAYVGDTVPPEDRARSLGWLSAGTNFGTMLGPVIGSFAALWGQAAPGIAASVLCLTNVFFAYRWLPESKKHGESARRKPVWHGAWMVIRHPRGPVERLTLIYATGMLAFSSMTSILALYLGAEFGVTEKTIGYVFLYVGIFSVIMRSALIGPIVDRIGETWCMRAGAASLMGGLIGFVVSPNLVALAFVIPLVPIGTALLFPSTTALMSKASAKAELGTTMGIAQTFAGLSRVIAPVISTNLFQRLGHTAPFYFAATVVGLVSLLALHLEAKTRVDAVHVVD